MTLTIRIVTFTFILLIAGCVQTATGTVQNWLVGKWELIQDPDGDEKDWLEFTRDGKAFSISPSGRRVPGTYNVDGKTISIIYTFKARQIRIELTANNDRTKLSAYSENTGNTSVYEKVQ